MALVGRRTDTARADPLNFGGSNARLWVSLYLVSASSVCVAHDAPGGVVVRSISSLSLRALVFSSPLTSNLCLAPSRHHCPYARRHTLRIEFLTCHCNLQSSIAALDNSLHTLLLPHYEQIIGLASDFVVFLAVLRHHTGNLQLYSGYFYLSLPISNQIFFEIQHLK